MIILVNRISINDNTSTSSIENLHFVFRHIPWETPCVMTLKHRVEFIPSGGIRAPSPEGTLRGPLPLHGAPAAAYLCTLHQVHVSPRESFYTRTASCSLEVLSSAIRWSVTSLSTCFVSKRLKGKQLHPDDGEVTLRSKCMSLPLRRVERNHSEHNNVIRGC